MYNQSIAQFTVKGDAFINNTPNQNCITLTIDDNFKSGGFWSNDPIDLTQPFEIATTINFGCNTNPDTGGDGIAFVIQNQSSTAGINAFGGGTLGYQGISPSVAIQMDTYRENPIDYPFINDPGGGIFNLPYYDHMALMLNGQVAHETPEDIVTVPFTPFYTDVEDCSTGNFHHITINWDPTLNLLNVYYCSQDGNFNPISETIDMSNNVFGGDQFVYWGFTGATGGATNLQSVCVDFATNVPLLQDTVICASQTLDLDFSHLDYFTFNWIDENGVSISNASSVSLDPDADTFYQLDLVNTCSGSSFSRTFNVQVLAPFISEVPSSHIDVSCYGQETGQLEVEFVNSIGSVQYEIDFGTPQSNGLFNNLGANTYNLLATDQNGCSDNIDIVISENPELILQIDNTQGVECNTTSTGFIETTPIGGIANYTLNWTDNNGNTYNDEDLFNINDGIYSYILTDNLNCQSSGQITIEQLNNIDIDIISQQDVICYQGFSGQIVVNPTGGQPPFDYSWTGPNGFTSSNTSINSLEYGEYFLTLTDDENCYRNFSFDIDQPTQVTSASSVFPTNCFNSNDGTISTVHSGGTGTTLPYLLNNNLTLISNANSTNNLSSGTYFSFAIDDAGCSSDTNTLVVNSANQIIIGLSDLQEVTCFDGNDGSIDINVSGGTPPYTNYTWVGPNAYSNSNQNIGNIFSGNYTVSVTDNNNCVNFQTYTVSQPTEITISEDFIQYVKCTGSNTGAIGVNISGGTLPYTNFSWTGPNGYVNSNQNIDSLFQGEYTITVVDNNNCPQISSFSVFEPDSILNFLYTTTKSCLLEDIGTTQIEIFGGVPPYTTNWFGKDPNELPYGNNYVEISDQANCIKSDSVFIGLFPQPTALFSIDSLLRKDTYYNTYNFTEDALYWEWEKDEIYFSDIFSPLVNFADTGQHKVSLKAINFFGCSDTISKLVYIADDLNIYIPNSFSPNNDLVNDTFKVAINNYNSFKLNIYNRYGQLIFESTDPSEGWDGKIGNDLAPISTYVMRVEILDLFGKLHIKNNELTLFR